MKNNFKIILILLVSILMTALIFTFIKNLNKEEKSDKQNNTQEISNEEDRKETLQNMPVLKSEMNLVTNEDLYGTWIKAIDGTDPASLDLNLKQGFTIKENGEIESFNMPNVQYTKWTLDGYKLILKSEVMGNGQTIEGEEKYIIDFIGLKKLKLRMGDSVEEYERLG